jgi:hypothetical protein
MSLIILDNSMDFGHVREERTNEPAGNLHFGNLVTQETEPSSKADAGIGDHWDIGARLWAVKVNADNDDRRDCLHKRYGCDWLVKYQRKKVLTASLPVRRSSVVGAALATLAVVATMVNAKR